MTAADSRAFAIEMAALAEVFGEQVSDVRLEGYFRALEDQPIEAVQAACRVALRTARFFPKPAEIRDLICGSLNDRAALAWVRFLRGLERIGTYQSVDFGDPVLHATIEALGGWTEAWRIERLGERDLSFKRQEFEQTYRALAHRGIADAPRRLIGQAEASNHSRGFLGHDHTLSISTETAVVQVSERVGEVPGESLRGKE